MIRSLMWSYYCEEDLVFEQPSAVNVYSALPSTDAKNQSPGRYGLIGEVDHGEIKHRLRGPNTSSLPRV